MQGNNKNWLLKSLPFFKRIFLCALFAIIAATTSPRLAQAELSERNVLILHSYSADYSWTNTLNTGITNAFRSFAKEYRLRTEFLDAKNITSPDSTAMTAELLRLKYAKTPISGIIVTDNEAMRFMEIHGHTIAPGAPIVATGINGAQPPSPDSPIHTVIAEHTNHSASIRTAQKIQPDAQTVHIISDTSTMGPIYRRDIKAALHELDDTLKVVFVPHMSLENLIAYVAARTETDLLYVLPYFRDGNGNIFAQGDAERALAVAAKIPIHVSWAHQIDTGVLGGNTINPIEQGVQAVSALMHIKRTGSAPAFVTDASLHTNIYDHTVMKRFKISRTLLPPGSIVKNRPFADTFDNASLAPLGLLGIILLTIIGLMGLTLSSAQTVNLRNQKIIKLDKEVIATQRELLTSLGELIEVRSHETSNHVKRVAIMSRMLGEHIGLPHAELDLLETASPLHDVGKIGIPESILHKPGKLTPEEFEIIKTHTNIGEAILHGSNRDLMRIACDIANQHHERWDGTGYPNKLKGKEISIYARITTITDIYDALASDRCYKAAWAEDDIIQYMKDERGKTFDPELCDLFLEHIAEAQDIRRRYANGQKHIEEAEPPKPESSMFRDPLLP